MDHQSDLVAMHGHLCCDCGWCTVAGEAGTVSIFSIPKQCLVETIKHTQDQVYSMAQNKDGSTLAMGSRNIHICD